MSDSTPATYEIRKADTRGTTNIGWLHSRHSFSFGQYRDAARMGFGPLRVINDDVVEPGQGFGEHPHQNMEILTWVLSGALKHGDSLGHMMTLKPGQLQAMTAGTGITHSEFNASETEQVHFLQIWLMPRENGVPPRYVQEDFDAAGRAGQWQALASGEDDAGAIPIATNAVVRIAELQAGDAVDVDVQTGRQAYVHVATGGVQVGDDTLTAGDALVTTTAQQFTLTATQQGQVLWFELY